MSATEHEPIEGELVPYVPQSPSTLFGSDDPQAVLAGAEKVAAALRDVLRQQGLTTTIQNREHVRVEGWTLLGSMLGVFPVLVWTRQLENGWEARVEARTRSGEVVGAAEAMVTRGERSWASRDEYALRSMAQTRATSKALRQPLGFVVTLAGYESTPAEERPEDGPPPSADTPPGGGPKISDTQQRKIGAMLRELEEKRPTPEGAKPWVDELKFLFGIKSRTELTKERASQVIEWLQKQIDDAEIPFG